MKNITCWGDSLTAGACGNGVSYPSVLEKLSGVTVYNYGVGGESAVTIAARQGAVPMELAESVRVQNGVPCEIKIKDFNGFAITPLMQSRTADKGINDCILDSVRGELDLADGKYYFTPRTAGKNTEIRGGTRIVTKAMLERTEDVLIIFMGQNGGFNNADELISLQRKMLEFAHNENEYLIVGLTTGNRADREVMDERLLEEYGDHFLNLREYLCSVVCENGEITFDDEDVQRAALGCVPKRLLADEVHFNADGYSIIGKRIFGKLCELNIL